MTEEKPKRSRGRRCFVVACVAIGLYLGAIGPLIALSEAGYISHDNRFLTTIYAPLAAVSHTGWFEGPMEEFVNWWRRIGGGRVRR
jgi:hypothetical protein